MRKSILYIVLLSALQLTLKAQIVSEVLSRPTDNSITLNVMFNSQCDAYFEYGISSGVYDSSTEISTSTVGLPLVIVFSNLLPDRQYYYHTCYRKIGTSSFITGDEHTFHTQRAKGSSFRFTIESDPHLYDKKGIPSMMRVTMQNQLNDKPDFVFDLGDTYGDDHDSATITQKQADQLHLNFLPYIGMVCHSAPYFFCLGNHEGENGFFLLQTPPDNMAVYSTLARKKYYSNPIPDGFYTGNSVVETNGIGLPENYYSWTWGDALFVVLDAYRGYTANVKPKNWDWTLGKEQYDWFKQTLENSSAKYKFVFIHHTLGETRGGVNTAKLFEWGGYDQKGVYAFATYRPTWDLPIHQLMVKNGVSIFFQGHDHLFAQEELDGLIYQETPMPSDSTYQIGMLANADAYVSNQIGGTGYLRVTVATDSAQVEFVRSYLPHDTNATHKNGEVAFKYKVAPTILSVTNGIHNPQLTINNYPNPFHEQTTINYKLPAKGQVTLKVFDFFGREIASLVNQMQESGSYSIPFSQQSIKNYELKSGIYYYQLNVNSTVITKKTVLIN